ncbi:MBL fold metallo-hydrolase [Haloferula sp. A504]|uniref:MBL fold metallo-hydrolase n=1 Tax=Haloferula sp. A504 TaxID=3373601 RepID=UPI0031C52480|nr:MBL fold metallo-hydrolase [Verrucomicrobiaceae bacterium E54]
MNELYNTAAEVVAKALRGLGLSPATVAGEAGVELEAMGAFLQGRAEPGTARPLALPLGLDPDALASFNDPPAPIELPADIRRIELPFEDETVNAWSIDGGSSLLVIDAGFGPEDLARRLPKDRTVDLLITHPHRDHLGGLEAVRGLHRLRAPVDLREAVVVQPGDEFEAAGRRISVMDLAGHHPQAVGYRIGGFDHPVVAVGDAVFARSIGGCPGPDAYRRARATIVGTLADLPDETILLTGHGPATTLGRERMENPFLAVWLSGGDAGP